MTLKAEATICSVLFSVESIHNHKKQKQLLWPDLSIWHLQNISWYKITTGCFCWNLILFWQMKFWNDTYHMYWDLSFKFLISSFCPSCFCFRIISLLQENDIPQSLWILTLLFALLCFVFSRILASLVFSISFEILSNLVY